MRVEEKRGKGGSRQRQLWERMGERWKRKRRKVKVEQGGTRSMLLKWRKNTIK